MSSIKLTCINSKNIPSQIPVSKHVKEGEEYELLYVWWSEGSKCWAFDLCSIEFSKECEPYHFYRGDRFSIPLDKLQEFMEFVQDCGNTNIDFNQLLEESQLTVVPNNSELELVD